MQKFINIILLVILILLSVSCKSEKDLTGDKITITVTLAPYKYLVEKIGGEFTDVILAIPAGANPHHYEPKPSRIQAIDNSEFYFMTGGNFIFEELLLDKLTLKKSSIKNVDLSKTISLLGNDPHIWASVKNLKIISKNIFNALSDFKPAYRKLFTNNYNKLIDSLNYTDSLLTKTISDIGLKYIVVDHSSWKYLARDYGLEEISIQKGSKQVNPNELKAYVDFIHENNIPLIFTDPQHNEKSLKVISEQIDLNIVKLNPISENPIVEFIKLDKTLREYYSSE